MSSEATGTHGTDEICAVLITAPDEQTALALARALVEARLAACVNLVPGVRSVYRWQGVVQDDGEILMIAKTRRARLVELQRRVHELHPYDVPEVIALPVGGGSEAYLGWIVSETPA